MSTRDETAMQHTGLLWAKRGTTTVPSIHLSKCGFWDKKTKKNTANCSSHCAFMLYLFAVRSCSGTETEIVAWNPLGLGISFGCLESYLEIHDGGLTPLKHLVVPWTFEMDFMESFVYSF